MAMNKRVPSDDLRRVSELSLHWQPLFRLLEILSQLRLVIDTNAVLEELMFLVRSRKNPAARTNLQEAIDLGAVVAFAPSKIPRARTGLLKVVARSVCLQAGVPLTVEELTRGVLRAGYESRSDRLKYYLVRVLRQDEQFVCMPDGRWTAQPSEGGLKLNDERRRLFANRTLHGHNTNVR